MPELYPLAAPFKLANARTFGLKFPGGFSDQFNAVRGLERRLRAVKTGEFRPPRRGEWFLSGAIVEAYHAANDLTTPYHIARLVEVETVTTERVVRELHPVEE